MTIERKFEIREIFIRHGKGLRRYPFAIATCKNNDTDEIIWEGMVANGDALYQQGSFEDELDTPQIMEPMIDPPFIGTNKMATGIYYGSY